MSSLKKTLLTSGLIMTLGVTLGRLTGFLRELALAHEVGAKSDWGDAAVLLLTFPDFVVAIIAGGAFSAALVPQIHSLPKDLLKKYFFRIHIFTFLAFSILTLLIVLGNEFLLRLLAPGLSPEVLSSALPLFNVAAAAIPLFALAAVSRSFLQASHRFGLISIEVAIYNTVLLFGILVLFKVHGLSGLVPVVFAAALLRWLPQFIQVLFQTPAPSPHSSRNSSGGWRDLQVLKSYAESLGANSLFIVLNFGYVAKSFSSHFDGGGAFALFSYAIKFIELPTALGVSIIGPIIFPRLSEMFKNDNHPGAERLIRLGTRILATLGLALMMPLLFLCLVNRDFSFQFGQLDQRSMEKLLGLLAVGLTALPPKFLVQMGITAMNAKKDTRTPLKISLFINILSLPMLYSCGAKWGAWGCMMGLSALLWAQCAAVFFLLHQRHKIHAFDRKQTKSLFETFFLIAVTLTPGLLHHALVGLTPAVSLFYSLMAMAVSVGLSFMMIPEFKSLLLRRPRFGENR